MVRLYRTFSIYSIAGKTRCAGCLCPRSGWFKHIEPLHYRDSKVWRVLTHEVGVARPYRNFSINIVKGETRCAGCFSTSSGWFKHIEPPRTYTNPCNDVDREGSVQLNHPELMSHALRVVRLYRTFSIYIVTGETRSAGCLCNSSGFKHIEPHRTYSNHNITEIARFGEVCHRSSGWFDCTEPTLSTALQGEQGVQGAYALVRGGSSTSNLIEPTRTTASQR